MFYKVQMTKANFAKKLEKNEFFLELPYHGIDLCAHVVDGKEDDYTKGQIGDWAINGYNPKDGMTLELAIFKTKDEAINYLFIEAEKELALEKDDKDLFNWLAEMQNTGETW